LVAEVYVSAWEMADKLESERKGIGIPAIVAGTILVLFALLNLDKVSVNWIVGTWRTPLIVVIVVSMLLGAALGWAFSRRRARH
jgi:uncharacterized integral membrane protein